MKQKTKLAGIDEIPEGWRIERLEEVSEIYLSNVDKKTFKDEYPVFLCNYMEVYNNNYITKQIPFMKATASQNEIEKFCLKKGDVIITKDSETKEDIAQSSVVVEELTNVLCGYHLALIRPNQEKINSIFLSKLFQNGHVKNYLISKANGITRFGLNQPTITKLPILIPPKKEQQKIAEILITFDEAIEETDNIIKKCETIKKELMEELTLKGLPKYNRKFRKTKIGEIPEDWNVLNLEKLGVFSKGKGISKKELSENGIPCIRYGEIYTTHHFLIKKFNSFIDKTAAEDAKIIFKNDILFAGSGETLEEIGKSVVYLGEEEAYAGGDIIILRVKNHNSLYLSFVLNSKMVLKQKRKLGQGNAVVHIYAKDLKTIKIPIPPIQEQERISEIFLTIDKCIEEEKGKKQSLKQLKKSLMQNLLTGKIRVKVN